MSTEIGRLSRLLVAHLGKQSATNELRWLRQAAQQLPSSPSSSSSTTTLERLLERRVSGEPLQYILGTQPFGPLDIRVRPPVLIPRTETEHWTIRLSEILIQNLPQRPLRILDLCTGSGCIPLLLLSSLRSASLSSSNSSPPSPSSSAHPVHALGVDISDDAIDLAQENAKYACPGISFIPSPLYPGSSSKVPSQSSSSSPHPAPYTFSTLQTSILSPSFPSTLQNLNWGPFDVITSNPPYIPLSEYISLPESVKDYEDPRALLGDPHLLPSISQPDGDIPRTNGNDDPTKIGYTTDTSPPPAPATTTTIPSDGLTFYRTLAQLVHSPLLRPGGIVALEVGHNQAPRSGICFF
ncbi:S-adenosyl-L-methionine-dependent methyltransferase [Pyrrhoderma noxium]|uniref:S-adenosyl-L-methionine-dependent methyltransferase n=1 Tax=Pyrrhoderma noxium TaxID=2282107 RepID=A0A286UGS8_9AGAM|nr:S-adenosyl-L-methionine-dependent methyltransferase [Pyrrhoderma noxium]